MAQQQMLLADVHRPLEQDLLISEEEESDDGDDSGNVSSNLDKFNMSFEKDQAFWKNASESLDEDEYLEFVKVNTRKPNDLEKFNKSFNEENEFWKKASKSLDEDGFEKLVEEECLDDPFDNAMEIDFEPYLNLFKKGHKFWNLATKNLQDQEYEKLVQIYIASEKITWNNLTSDAFLSQPKQKIDDQKTKPVSSTDPREAVKNKEEEPKVEGENEDTKPFNCDLCPKIFKIANQLKLHKEFNHSNDGRLTCNFCFRRFKQFDALQKHREMHTQ